jgi:hypothetical protein
MKIEYKRSYEAKEMSLSKPIMINEKTICDFKGSGSKSISTFHGVTFNFDKKTLGGVLDSEIVKVWEQVVKDYDAGFIVAATMGVELEGGKRHLHISVILSERALTAVTGDRYRNLINESRLSWKSYKRKNGDEVKSCTTVVSSQPNGLKGGVRHSAYNWLSYSLKEMAKDFNDVNVFARDVDFTNGNDFKTIGMFDGSDNDQRRKEKMANCIFIAWQKKCSEKNGEPETISTGGRLSTQALEFMQSVGIDEIAWTVEGDRKTMALNQAKIITKMVLNNIGKKRYNLDKKFFGKGGDATYELVMGLKPLPNQTSQDYENELYSAILKQRANALRIHVESKVEQGLLLENEKLKKKYLRLENVCKGHLITIDNLKRHKTNKRARNKQIKEYQRLQRKEDRYQDKMEEKYSDYCRNERSAKKYDDKIAELRKLNEEEEATLDIIPTTLIKRKTPTSTEQLEVQKRQRVE